MNQNAEDFARALQDNPGAVFGLTLQQRYAKGPHADGRVGREAVMAKGRLRHEEIFSPTVIRASSGR
jgi:hypothetical protein